MGLNWPQRTIFLRCANAVSVSVLRLYDFVRLSSYCLFISDNVLRFNARCDIHIAKFVLHGVWSVDWLRDHYFKRCFFSFNKNVRTRFLDTKSLGKDIEIEFISEILSYGVLKILLVWLRWPFVFDWHNTKVVQVCWNGIHLILVQIQVNINILVSFLWVQIVFLCQTQHSMIKQ